MMFTREDHFEMNFMEKIYKFAKSLVKIGTSNAPRRIKVSRVMYLILLSNARIYKDFRDVVASPNVHYRMD